MKNRIVTDEIVYTGAICRVHRIGLRGQDGQVIPRDLVEMSDAAVIVPVRRDGAFVLIENDRFAIGQELLEFPAGKLEPGEDPVVCAARELNEETGFRAGRIVRLGGFYTCPGALTEYMHVFLADDLEPGRQATEAHECIRVKFVQPPRLREMVCTGDLHDGKSIAAYLLWALREKK